MKAKKAGKAIVAAVLLPGIVYGFFSVLRPEVFLTGFSTLYVIMIQSITTSIIAWGMNFSMCIGMIDFSIAAEMILYEILATIFYGSFGFMGMLILTVMSAFVIGLLKAFVKELIGVRSMVIGIGLAYILASLGEMLSQGRSTIIDSSATILAVAPYNFIILICSGIIAWYLDARSIFGSHARAIGGGLAISKSAGISEQKISVQASLIGSLFAGVAALFTLSRGSGVSASHGLESLSSAFTALMCIFIASSLAKYLNFVIGVFVGAVAMNALSIGLVSIGFDSELNGTVTSAFLLVLIIVSFLSDKKAADKLRREVANAKFLKAKSALADGQTTQNL